MPNTCIVLSGCNIDLPLHLRIIGRPGRIGALEKFLAHAVNKPGVWIATRSEIAHCFAAKHPFVAT